GRVVRSRKPLATRGLNRNCNRRFKGVFISAGGSGRPSGAFPKHVLGVPPRGGRDGSGGVEGGREDVADVVRVLEERRNVRSEETEFDDIAVSSGLPAER